MILFLANTPSQLLNAVVLSNTEFRNEKCDLYCTSNIREASFIFREEGCLNEVYEITLLPEKLPRNTKINKTIVRIGNALKLNTIKRNLPSNPLKYTRMFLAGVGLRNIEIFYAIKKINRSIKLSLFEEGTYEYCAFGEKKEWGKILFSYIFFGHYYLYESDSLYVYMPDLVVSEWKNLVVKKIPSLREQQFLLASINKAFGYKHTNVENYSGKCIILEQAFQNQQFKIQQNELIKRVISYFGKNNVIIKLHPRSSENKYGKDIQYLNTKQPFEIIALNEDVSRGIFVSVTSSAITNFKVILNMEPTIIVLYKLFNSKNQVFNANQKFITRVKAICEKNKFYIPDDNDELIEILNSTAR